MRQIAFAAWLTPNEFNPDHGFYIIHKDLRFIVQHRRGVDWCRRSNALDLF